MKRRDFLGVCALFAGSFALPPLVGRPRAQQVFADPDSARPHPLIVVYSHHGVLHPEWEMRFPGTSDSRPWSASLLERPRESFSAILEPLYPFRERLLVLDGLALVSASLESTGLPHKRGRVHSLTGAPMRVVGDTATSTAPSVDQIIAEHIASDARLRSLDLGVGALLGPDAPFVYRDAGTPLRGQRDLATLRRRFFGRNSRYREDIIALGELARAQADLALAHAGPGQIGRLSRHRDMVGELVRRTEGVAELSCPAPALLSPDRAMHDYEAAFVGQVDLLVRALQCDLTRVVTLELNQLPTELIAAPPGDVHFDYAHNALVDDVAHEVMRNYGRYHAEQVATLLAALDAVDAGDGQSLLDRSTVLWLNELGGPAHSLQDWPVIVAGGGSGWSMGRYLRWPRRTRVRFTAESGDVEALMGKPHQHFLVSLAQAFGLERDAIGTERMLDRAGETLELTGPLAELFG